MNTGNKVKIYENPVTQELYEGEATLASETREVDPFTWDGVQYEMHFWTVCFDGDASDMIVERRIRVKKAISIIINELAVMEGMNVDHVEADDVERYLDLEVEASRITDYDASSIEFDKSFIHVIVTY